VPLSGKVAIVTGAAQGIGLACARRLAEDGAKVVLGDIDEKQGAKAAEELRDAGLDVLFTVCDVTERLKVQNMIKLAVSNYERVDILVNNAAIVHGAGFLELTEEDFDRVLSVNLKGYFLCGQAAARQMVKQVEAGDKPGAIINMSSINAVFAIGTQVPYSVSKGGINQLTKVMALELAPFGIRVNAIGPGSIMTRMLDDVNDDKDAKTRILSRTPMGRIGKAEEIASIAAFLASSEASYVTGQTIYADGGRLGLNYTVPVKDQKI